VQRRTREAAALRASGLFRQSIMKRAERHHLKHNELADFAAGARQAVEERKKQITTVVVVVAVIAAVAIGYFTWRGIVDRRAHTLLAEALVVEDARVGPPPAPGQPATGLSFATQREKHQAALTKFKVVADEYPSTDAGVFARYREATTFMALGNPGNAATAYQQTIDKGGNSVYAQMARLGLAEAQAQTGQFDQAITTFRELAERKDARVPVDGVLIRLGRT
jgi:TolA-binding protein